jgi:hydroxymethylglutaryl-CoA reductase
MAIEESSVVAAATKSANYWSTRGGFKATVINTEKIGQVHFLYKVMFQRLFFVQNKAKFFLIQKVLQKTCKKRWRILDIVLMTRPSSQLLPTSRTFETKDSMGLILLIPA